MAKNPDRAAISRGSRRINASLMPHSVALMMTCNSAALVPVLAHITLLSRALTRVPKPRRLDARARDTSTDGKVVMSASGS